MMLTETCSAQTRVTTNMLQTVPLVGTIVSAVRAAAWWSKPEWWSALGTFSAATVALFVALFGETIAACIRRPKLDLSVAVDRPDCVRTKLTNPQTGEVVADCYYFRVMVSNRGSRRAEDVELYATMLEREIDGELTRVDGFPPMDLLWSHVRRPLQGISPGLQKHCDLGYIRSPDGLKELVNPLFNPTAEFCFDLEVKPNLGGWSIGAGTYRLHLALAAANIAKAQKKVLEIKFNGRWLEDERAMFDEGINIRMVGS